MSELYASKMINQAKSWMGLKESNGSYLPIIDIYNAMPKTHGIPLPRGYKMTKNDAWCAAFISALALAVNFHKIIPIECSCSKMIEQAKKMGIWFEDESITPPVGALVLYDWEDKSGASDNKGNVDHIGIVERVEGKTFYVIEGNFSDAVKCRTVKVNGEDLRGFIIPKYDAEPVNTPTVTTPTETKIAPEYAMEFHENKAGSYYVKMPELKKGAADSKKTIATIGEKVLVRNFGYHTKKWLLVMLDNGITGFIHEDDLIKV